MAKTLEQLIEERARELLKNDYNKNRTGYIMRLKPQEIADAARTVNSAATIRDIIERPDDFYQVRDKLRDYIYEKYLPNFIESVSRNILNTVIAAQDKS